MLFFLFHGKKTKQKKELQSKGERFLRKLLVVGSHLQIVKHWQPGNETQSTIFLWNHPTPHFITEMLLRFQKESYIFKRQYFAVWPSTVILKGNCAYNHAQSIEVKNNFKLYWNSLLQVYA